MSNPGRSYRRDAFFLGSGVHRRFALTTVPDEQPVGTLLFVPPFAEEMNRCRRMAALAAQHFASQGWLVIQIDLKGTGDSAGEFGQTVWFDWLDDLDLAWNWLQSQGEYPCAVWSLRAGSLLTASWLHRSGQQAPLLLWQPVARGDRFLNQFLRYKSAVDLLQNGKAEPDYEDLKVALGQGEAVEVAGYVISAALAEGMAPSVLELPTGYKSPVAIFEVSSRTPPVVSLGTERLAELLRESSADVTVEPIPGPAFWQSREIEVADGLLLPSSRALKGFL